MTTRGICGARCQAFHTAMIEKEENTRIKWFLRNQQKLLERLGKSKEMKLPPEHEPEKHPREDTIRLKSLPNWRPLEPDGSINMNIMKSVDPQIKAILYEDVPSFIAAENYMNKRLKGIPENRYYYPDCTSWIHGWRLTDYPPVPRNTFGRQAVIKREFYHPRISSLQTDPEWYRPSRIVTFICDEEMN